MQHSQLQEHNRRVIIICDITLFMCCDQWFTGFESLCLILNGHDWYFVDDLPNSLPDWGHFPYKGMTTWLLTVTSLLGAFWMNLLAHICHDLAVKLFFLVDAPNVMEYLHSM